jgi:threonine synthase
MTPLLAASSMQHVWLKDETRNPSGSAKDRAMSVAMSKGVELKRTASIIASTGSAGLSAAAYAARARIPSVILVPHDTPGHRLALMRRYVGRVIQVDGPFELLMELLDHAREQLGYYDASTYSAASAYQAEGRRSSRTRSS